MGHYTAGWSIPGCLPETDPGRFGTFAEAIAYLAETVDRFWDEDTDAPGVDADARWLDVHTALHGAAATHDDGAQRFAETTGDGHLTFWVEPAD